MADKSRDQSKKRIERLIFRDELTNVFNRRYLFQYLPQEISQAKDQRESVWLFMIDIDDFKTINDKFGHLGGDKALKNIAAILQKCVRENDTVIRYAGDEFTIIVPSVDMSGALLIADKILKEVSGYNFTTDSGSAIGRVNVSIGIASYPEDADDHIQLIDLADKALYASKQAGKNRVSQVSDISADALRGREIIERFPCVKLIEREKQWQQLLDAYNKTLSQKKVEIIAITGQSGVGKTRILDDFSEFVSSNGNALIFEHCAEKSMTQPYSNLLHGLEEYLRSKDSSDRALLDGLSDLQCSILARAITFLEELFNIKIESDDLSRQQRDDELRQGLITLLKNIAIKKALFILFDDFHLIDENTLTLFDSLKDQESQILLCFAFTRTEFLTHDQGEFNLFKIGAALISRAKSIELQNLSAQGVSEMINAILELASPQQLSGIVFKISKGNPLFVEEILKFLIQKGFLYYHKGKWGNIEINESDIPSSLEDVIRERIKNLDKTAQDIISKAAVIGHDFNVDLLHRMGKEDEGYILDLLESAKRAGLIKETVTAYGGELSFVSDEIRKVLYSLMTQDKTKSLHKKLGEIEESLHANNLDKIAGELFYHFKKAEEHHRATQYIKRIKEAKGLFYDRAIKYAKEILEGVEERKILPLSPKSSELIPDIVRLIYVITLNTMLYPPRSEMVVNPTEDLFKKFSQIFVRDETIMFSEVKETLVINGERIKGIIIKKTFEDSFISFLKSHSIDNLTFKRGLTKAEFASFMESIAKAPADKSISDIVKTKELFHIEVNDISYDLIDRHQKKKERERLEEAMLIDYLLGKMTGAGQDKGGDFSSRLETQAHEIADAITKIGQIAAKDGKDKDSLQADVVAKSIHKISDEIMGKGPKEWDKNKRSLAKTIMNLEPKLRKDVLLSVQMSSPDGKKSLFDEIIPEFPDEVIVDLLTDEFKSEKASPAKLKSLVQKFLSKSEQRQRILPQLKNKFTREGLSQNELAWVFGEQHWQDFNLEERVKRFLEINVYDYINLVEEIDVKRIIIDLIPQGRSDLLNKVFNKWASFLKVASVEIKRKLSDVTHEIILCIPSLNQEILSDFCAALCTVLMDEADLGIFSSFIGILARRAIYFIDRKDFAPATVMLHCFNNICAKISRDDLQKALEDFKNQIYQQQRLAMISQELILGIDGNVISEDISELICEIGEPILDLVLQEAMIDEQILSSLGYFGAFLRKRAIGEMMIKIMEKIGKELIVQRLQSNLSNAHPHVVKNTVELFLSIHDQSLAKYLEPVLNHNDINIKTKLIFALGKIAGGDAIELLLKALRDKNINIRLYSVRVLSKIGNKGTIVRLREYMKQPELEREIEAAIRKIEARS